MPSHHTKQQQPTVTEPPVDPGSIPDKPADSWDNKLKLTESNLHHWFLWGWEKQKQILPYERRTLVRILFDSLYLIM